MVLPYVHDEFNSKTVFYQVNHVPALTKRPWIFIFKCIFFSSTLTNKAAGGYTKNKKTTKKIENARVNNNAFGIVLFSKWTNKNCL